MPTFDPDLSTDPTGFPMIRIPELGAAMHWFPVTKVQFELFLASRRDRDLGAKIYDVICQCNRRVSPQDVHAKNYWQAFVSGILPREAEAFASWCGPAYRIPTLPQWLLAYRALGKPYADDINWESCLSPVPPRRLELVRILDRVSRAQALREQLGASRSNLADRMFLRHGLSEWVHDGNKPATWGALGEPHPSLSLQLTALTLEDPIEPRNAHEVRVPYCGFRLLRLDDPTSYSRVGEMP